MTMDASQLTVAAIGRQPRSAADAGVEIRLSRPGDREAVLRFIEEMGFNARDAATWDGLKMNAMTAWRGSRLVGAIPLEPRWWQVRSGCVVPSVHQTTVGVLPEFQGRGIGSLMQDAIYAHEPALASIATVFREDETSPAYRWYRRNGFASAMRISAWLLETPSTPGPPDPVQFFDPDDLGVDWTGIDELWQTACSDWYGGFVCRRQRSLKNWLSVHPYRNRYSFKLLLMHDAGTLVTYAVLGIGQLHSKTTRVEIMEHAARDGEPFRVDQLCRATIAFAQQHGYRPVRWAMTADDPKAEIARRNGFTRNWRFDLLWRPLPSCEVTLPDAVERQRLWRYHSLDYT